MSTQTRPVVIVQKVRWGEMDALGHVNNAVYFKYFEDVRIILFDKLGFNSVTASDPEGPILAHIDCQFLRPISYPDTLTIDCWVEKIGRTSMHVHHEIHSEALATVAARGTSVVVLIDYKTGGKVPLTDAIKEQIKALQPDFEL